MVNDERMLLTSMRKDGQICTAGNERLQVKAIGDASLQVGDVTIQLLDVLYVPKLNSNLLSVQGLCHGHGCSRSKCHGQGCSRSRIEVTGNRQAVHAPVKGEGAG